MPRRIALPNIRIAGLLMVLGARLLMSAEAGHAAGLAAAHPRDAGLGGNPEVLFFEDFEGEKPALAEGWWGGKAGRALVRDAAFAFGGNTCLSARNVAGTHNPFDTFAKLKAPVDAAYLRFATRFEDGYDFGQGVKGPGLAAKAAEGPPAGGAGVKPTGTDKYECRVCFAADGAPYLYYYHMDMGQWGSNGKQTLGAPVRCVPGRWYVIEMMLKANAPDAKDGELKLWIDGELKAHCRELRWRTTETLKLNWIFHSAYFGGSWTSPKDQVRFEDNIAVARAYIGLPAQGAPPVFLAEAPSPAPPNIPKRGDPEALREAVIAALRDSKSVWPVTLQWHVLGKLEQVEVREAGAAGPLVRLQGNDLPLRWKDLEHADLARLLASARGAEGPALLLAARFAAAANQTALFENLFRRLAEVDAALANQVQAEGQP